MLRYLSVHPQAYPDLCGKTDFSKAEYRRQFEKIRGFTESITVQEYAAFTDTETAQMLYNLSVPNNPDKLREQLIKCSIIRKAMEENRTDILDECLTEEEIPESGNETEKVWTDWYESASLADVREKISELNTAKAKERRNFLKLCRGGLLDIIKPFDLEHEEIAEERYIVEGVMMECNIGNVIGASKQGKSYFIEEMLFCIENGLPWADRKTVQHHCVLFDFELTKSKLKSRYRKLLEKYRTLYPDREFKRFEIIPMIEHWGKSNVSVQTILDWIKQYVEVHPDTKVIALDPFYRWFDGENENDNTEVKKCLEKFIPLKNAGLSFIYAHHTGKGGKSNNPLEDGCGASCHGRVVDFAFGLKGSNEKGFKAILRGREDNAEIPMYRDEYGFFNYDPASDDTISKMSEEQKRALEEWLDGKEKQVKSIPKSIGKFNSKELRAAGFCVEKVDSNLKIRSRKGFLNAKQSGDSNEGITESTL